MMSMVPTLADAIRTWSVKHGTTSSTSLLVSINLQETKSCQDRFLDSFLRMYQSKKTRLGNLSSKLRRTCLDVHKKDALVNHIDGNGAGERTCSSCLLGITKAGLVIRLFSLIRSTGVAIAVRFRALGRKKSMLFNLKVKNDR